VTAGRPATRRAGAVALTALAALVLGAGPAAADPPAPTDYRSVIDDVEPAAGAVDVEVVGGDSFLRVSVDEGHEVVVAGYRGEPYVRIAEDGTVERNRRSPATYVNEDRQGDVDLPGDADADAEPEWERVGDGGTYAWHDHRIHWMNAGAPPVERGGVVQDWTVELTVDGRPTTVAGRLLWEEGVSPWPWVALGVVALAAVVVASRRWRRRGSGGRGSGGLLAAGAAGAGAALALAIGAAQFTDAPDQGAASPLLVVVPLAGLVAAGLAVVLARRAAPASVAPTAAVLAAAAAVLGWAVLRIDVLWKPVLPTGLAYGADRAGTALALGLAAAAAVVTVAAAGIPAPAAGAEPDPEPAGRD
jgi:hypothetical protein